MHTPATDRDDLHLGREPRVLPQRDIGPFRPHRVTMPSVSSFATSGGLSKVPTLNKEGLVVSSTVPNFPAISANTYLSVYSSTHRITGLPEHVEKVWRSDLGLLKLRDLLEYDLDNVGRDNILNVFVVDFVIDTSQTISWHTNEIFKILQLFTKHPQGGFCRFAQTFVCPKYVVPNSMSNVKFRPPVNYLGLYSGINKYILSKMNYSGSKSCFGSERRHVGISKSGKGWVELAWKGFRPESPESILGCTTLSKAYALKRSVQILRALEGEVRALPGK